MKIGLHGGNCCGVKHIYNLGCYPITTKLAAREAIPKLTSFGQKCSGAVNDMILGNPKGKRDFFNEVAPQETPEERFNRFINFIKTNRPHGIIEVVINTSQFQWVPVFEKHGFKKVSEAVNSNTHHTISIYHLVY